MENQQLYIITIVNTKEPLLLGPEKILVIYDDQQKAELSAKKQQEKYVYTSLVATPIEDKTLFFSKMAACNVTQFLLNGDGQILQAEDFGCSELPKITDDVANLQQKIAKAQPRLKTVLPSYSGSAKNSLKDSKLPVIICIILLILVIISNANSDDDSKKKKSSSSSKTPYSSEDYRKQSKEEEQKRQKMIQDIFELDDNIFPEDILKD